MDQHVIALAARPVWVFNVDVVEGVPKWLQKLAVGREEHHVVGAIKNHEISLQDHKRFSGVLQATQMPFLLRPLFTCFGGRFGDLRDWDDVERWGDRIALEVQKHGHLTSHFSAQRSFAHP